jgi:hypothetical protein
LSSSSADAYSATDSVDFGKNLAVAFILFGLGAIGILIWQVQSPIFHTILDTSVFLPAGLSRSFSGISASAQASRWPGFWP